MKAPDILELILALDHPAYRNPTEITREIKRIRNTKNSSNTLGLVDRFTRVLDFTVGGEWVHPGVYSLLTKLEKLGLVESTWQEGQYSRCPIYRLTHNGQVSKEYYVSLLN